jgi:hypothetical protein
METSVNFVRRRHGGRGVNGFFADRMTQVLPAGAKVVRVEEEWGKITIEKLIKP